MVEIMGLLPTQFNGLPTTDFASQILVYDLAVHEILPFTDFVNQLTLAARHRTTIESK